MAAEEKPYKAIRAVILRLLQMNQLWHEAADNYFYPTRFQISLQNCISVSRTVTFILQANKKDIKCFEEWYTKFQNRWRTDQVMLWAKDARNEIEKRGDLETHSQVRAEIIASYMGGPTTKWLPQLLFASPQDVFRSIPNKFRIPHVLEHGTLLIERRWADGGLPEIEVLEALAYVYSQLVEMVVDFLNTHEIPVPPVLLKTKPDAMGALAMDRAIYLSMSDGSVRGFRYFKKELKIDRKDKIQKRYGKFPETSHLKNNPTFRSISEYYFKIGRSILIKDGYHANFTFFLKGVEVIRILRTDHPDRASRYVLMRDLARLARIEGADGVLMIAEAWTAKQGDIPKSGFAVEAKNRGEALVMNAGNSNGEMFVLHADFERRKIRSNKIREIIPTVEIDSGFMYIFYPFMTEWGCVDQEKLAKSFETSKELGIEDPIITSSDQGS